MLRHIQGGIMFPSRALFCYSSLGDGSWRLIVGCQRIGELCRWARCYDEYSVSTCQVLAFFQTRIIEAIPIRLRDVTC